jgi:hypothetical protein
MGLSCTEWAKRFSSHLLTLREMKLPTAMDIAIEQFDEARDVSPEEAATAYAMQETTPVMTERQPAEAARQTPRASTDAPRRPRPRASRSSLPDGDE